MDLCEYCLKPADHVHPTCGHCYGTSRCPVAFCIVCADPRYDDLPFSCGTCFYCCGEGIDFSFLMDALEARSGNGEIG